VACPTKQISKLAYKCSPQLIRIITALNTTSRVSYGRNRPQSPIDEADDEDDFDVAQSKSS